MSHQGHPFDSRPAQAGHAKGHSYGHLLKLMPPILPLYPAQCLPGFGTL